MLRRFRLGLALGSVVVLLLQAAIAGASAVACMKACEGTEAPQSKCGSCPSEKASRTHSDSDKGCNGACKYVCSVDKGIATPSPVTTTQFQQLDVPFVTQTSVETELAPNVSEPELFETDSSPPHKPAALIRGLRAPPTFGA